MLNQVDKLKNRSFTEYLVFTEFLAKDKLN